MLNIVSLSDRASNLQCLYLCCDKHSGSAVSTVICSGAESNPCVLEITPRTFYSDFWLLGSMILPDYGLFVLTVC